MRKDESIDNFTYKTTQNSHTHSTHLTVKGLSTNLPSASVQDSSKVMQIKAVVHGSVVCPLRTLQDSLQGKKVGKMEFVLAKME